MYEFASRYLDEGFAQSLLGRYVYGEGKPYELTPRAFIEHVDPQASIWDPNFATRSGKLSPGLQSDIATHCAESTTCSGSFVGRYRFGAFNGGNGGIGYFMMEAHGTVTFQQNSKGGIDWELQGDAAMLIPDVYDFDWSADEFVTAVKRNYEQGEPDISYREPRTAAGSLIPGTPYAIDLDGTVRVWQSSKMPQAAFSE